MPDLLFLWLWVTVLVTGASTQRCSGDGEDPPRSFPSYRPPLVPRVQSSAHGLRPLYDFGRSFLHAVQPNAFPEDLLAKVLRNGIEEQDIAKFVQYDAGYLVCLILAVLYLLFMPIAGALLLWRQRSPPDGCASPSSRHKDVAVSVCLVLTTLLLL
ncbi:hypothetical protein NHX12_028892 [Muraenolepis orangiensis]|uniref:Uncharacterized protein n=1 Tax=Muraenolepis orangiensis TaxID=630683 RepID=A0A9Q0IP91_9TELE|nr:hypothetical protein NHX12_028892 [Muraenolepis orangiensis]